MAENIEDKKNLEARFDLAFSAQANLSDEELEKAAGGKATVHFIKYTVKRGDNIEKIAHKFNVSWKTIYNANRKIIKNVNHLEVGWVLTIPRF